jgi:hypothetical protein
MKNSLKTQIIQIKNKADIKENRDLTDGREFKLKAVS